MVRSFCIARFFWVIQRIQRWNKTGKIKLGLFNPCCLDEDVYYLWGKWRLSAWLRPEWNVFSVTAYFFQDLHRHQGSWFGESFLIYHKRIWVAGDFGSFAVCGRNLSSTIFASSNSSVDVILLAFMIKLQSSTYSYTSWSSL